MPDKVKLLYDTVSKDYDVGTYEQFSSKLQDEGKRKAFYDGVGAEYDLGDYATFSGKVKKNSNSQQGSATGSEGYGVGSGVFQSKADTITPVVTQQPSKYVKPATKPKTLPEAVDDDNNYLGAVWNQIANSGSDFIGGMTRLIAKSNPYGSPVMAGVADELGNRASIVTDNSFRTESSSKSNEEKIQSGFDLSNGISLDDAKALPLLISRFAADAGLAIPTAGASFIAQGYNTGLKEYDKATEGQPVDQNTRELFGIGYAGINGLLDKLSLGLITKSPTVAKGIKKTILGLGIKELAKVEGKITNEIIEQAFNKVAKQSFNKIKTAGVKAFTSGAIEGSTESGQGALSDGLKLLTNKLSDKEIFNKEEIVEGFLANRLNDFGGGAILGGAMGGGVALLSSKSIIAKRVAESTTPEQLEILKSEIASEVEAGTMDADRAESLMVAVDKYAGAKKKLPTDLSTKQTEKALDTIIERDAVADAIKQKTEQAAKSDEALAPQTKQELDLLEAKRQSLNDNIVEVTTDEKYSYSVDPESGKYFKQLGEDGKPEEITEQQYKLEKQVAPKVEIPKADGSGVDGDKIFYHGTPNKEFNGDFDERRIGKRDSGFIGRGFYFTEDKSIADQYQYKGGKKGKILERKLDIKNPLLLDKEHINPQELSEDVFKYIDEERQKKGKEPYRQEKREDDIAELTKKLTEAKHGTIVGRDLKEWIDVSDYAKSRGYDAIIGSKEVVVFDKSQIKQSPTQEAEVTNASFEQSAEISPEQTNLDSKPQDDLLLDGEQVTGEPTNTDTAVETNQGAGAIDQATNNPDVSEVGGEAVNTVLQKAETDLSALKQVENKSAKYEGSVKRLTEAKNAGTITESEFNDLLNRFDDVMAEYTPKGVKAVNLNESIPDGVLDDSQESKSAKAKELSGKIRALKIGGNGKVFDSTLGLPVAIWDGAVETVALAIEAGAEVANAIKRGINYIQKNHRGQWDKKAYNDTIIKELGLRGIEVNGEDLIVKPLEDKQTVELINGFYSPLEKGISEAKPDSATGKGWTKILSGVTEKDELVYTSVGEFLDNNADRPISKKELLDYMKNNRIDVVEVVKWEPTEEDIRTYLDDGYDRDEAIEYLSNGGGSTKFAQYQLEGEKENYKEVLVTLPQKVIPNERIYEVRKLDNGYSVFNTKTNKFESLAGVVSEQEAQKRVDSANNLGNNRFEDTKFKSSHFDEPNILVHLRMNTRTDAEGNKVLFIEEIQSDWGQKGKKEGFNKNPLTTKEEERFIELDKKNKLTESEQNEYDKLLEKERVKAQTPPSPFVTDTNSWVKLGLKTALKEAVSQGADKIAWTTGEQQNDRYDLSKSVQAIAYAKRDNGNYDLRYIPKGGRDTEWTSMVKDIPASEIENHVGKELSQKIVNGEGAASFGTPFKIFNGVDLKLGGKGMKGFYGSPADGSIGIIGGVAKSLFKREPKTVTFDTGEGSGYDAIKYDGTQDISLIPGNDYIKDGDWLIQDPDGVLISSMDAEDLPNKQEALNEFYIDSNGADAPIEVGKGLQTQHSIDITPELIESVKSGLPLFKNELSIVGEVKKPSAEKLTEIKARRDAAYKRVRAKGAQANTLFSPEVITDLVEIGSTYIEEGIVRFSDFAERLQKEYGKEIPTSVIEDVYEQSATKNGLGIRKFTKSIQDSELSNEVKEAVNSSDYRTYTKQKLDEIENKVEDLSEVDRIAAVSDMSTLLSQMSDKDTNFGVIAGISLINQYDSEGRTEDADRIIELLSKSSTVLGQTLRQFGQLKKSSAIAFTRFIEKQIGEKGKKLTDEQKKRIAELFNIQKDLFEQHEKLRDEHLEKMTKQSRINHYAGVGAYNVATRNLENYIEELLPRELANTLSTVLKLNLLTLKSLIANPIYNVMFAPVRFAKGEIANAVDKSISLIAGTPRTKISSLSGDAISIGANSVIQGSKNAWEKMMRGSSGGDMAKLDIDRRLRPLKAWERLWSKDDEFKQRKMSEKMSDFVEGTFGWTANANGRLLPFGDDPVFEMAKNHRLLELAKTKGFKGDDIERFMIKPDEASLKSATEYGRSATFQDSNILSSGAIAGLKSLEEYFTKLHPFAGGAIKVLGAASFPFVKTPASVAIKIVKYAAPVIPASKAFIETNKAIKATKAYKLNPSDYNRDMVIKHQRLLAEATADFAISVALVSIARIVVANGLLTGSAPEEKERRAERDFMYATQPPFTLNISGLSRLVSGGDPSYNKGDTAITYNVLGVLGAILGIVNDTKGADLREMAKKAKQKGLSGKPYFPEADDSDWTKWGGGMLGDAAATLPASVKFLTEQSFLQGVESVMAAISKGDYERWSTQLFRTLLSIPVPNSFIQLNRVWRENMRDPYAESQLETMGNIVEERMRVGDGGDLPVRIDIWGEKVKQTPDSANKFLFQVIDPFRTQNIMNDPTTLKVFDIFRKTQDTGAIPPSVDRYIVVSGEKRRLNKEQYQQLLELVGKSRKSAVDVILKNYNPNKVDKLEIEIGRLKSAYSYGLKIGRGKFIEKNKEFFK